MIDQVNRRREVPTDIPAVTLSLAGEKEVWIAQVLRDAGLANSSSEANRLVLQGAVRIDGEVVTERDLQLGTGEYLIQRGKRKFARVLLAEN